MSNEREEKVLFNEEFLFSHSILQMARTKSQIRDGNIAQTKIALMQGVVLFEGGVFLDARMSISEKTIEWQTCPRPRFSLLYNVDDMPFGVFIYSGAAVSIYT